MNQRGNDDLLGVSVSTASSTADVGGTPLKVRVSLRVYGELLDPGSLTDGFGVNPSQSYRRGDVIAARRADAVRPHGMWLLDSPLPPDAPIDEQIESILDQLPDSSALWEHLTGNYNRDLFCGVFTAQQVSGVLLPARTLVKIASRHLDVHVDLIVESDPEQE